MKTDWQFCINQFQSLILPIILSVLGSRPPCLRCEGERGEGAVVCCCCCCGVYKTGPGTPELISFTGPRVMRAGTAAKIAAATWLGKHDFMWEDDKMSIEYALQLATLRLLKVLALAKMLNWIHEDSLLYIRARDPVLSPHNPHILHSKHDHYSTPSVWDSNPLFLCYFWEESNQNLFILYFISALCLVSVEAQRRPRRGRGRGQARRRGREEAGAAGGYSAPVPVYGGAGNAMQQQLITIHYLLPVINV